MENTFYEHFIRRIKTKDDQTFLNKQEIIKLYKAPKKDKGDAMPHIDSFEKNQVYQVDLLFLPDDRGYKYCIVVVDDHDGITDAEPMKDKNAETCLKAIQKIYNRKILKMPSIKLECDNGAEFHGVFQRFHEQNHISIRYALPGRHRQQGLVENRNKIIGKAISMYQTSMELVRHEECKQWVDILPDIINEYNKVVGERYKKRIDEPRDLHEQEILTIGTKVRIQLDNPTNLRNEKLPGRFRAGDPKWSRSIHTITNILIKPDKPVLYHISGIDGCVFTKNQLQEITNDEQEPDATKLKNNKNQNEFRIKKILYRKGDNVRSYKYLISWYGYGPQHDSWEPRATLLRSYPDLIHSFDANFNN